ncbi:hypothetical protein NMY22_g442 [Coprinellus aureogranulatus]|nr:hypothetical protein NMY22_g442 [Coprinellus aureogranulatus]
MLSLVNSAFIIGVAESLVASSSTQKHEDRASRGTRPLSIARSSRSERRSPSMNSDVLHMLLEVELTVRHSVTGQITNMNSEIDDYFDSLESSCKKIMIASRKTEDLALRTPLTRIVIPIPTISQTPRTTPTRLRVGRAFQPTRSPHHPFASRSRKSYWRDAENYWILSSA